METTSLQIVYCMIVTLETEILTFTSGDIDHVPEGSLLFGYKNF
jgi:hypothetical protein